MVRNPCATSASRDAGAPRRLAGRPSWNRRPSHERSQPGSRDAVIHQQRHVGRAKRLRNDERTEERTELRHVPAEELELVLVVVEAHVDAVQFEDGAVHRHPRRPHNDGRNEQLHRRAPSCGDGFRQREARQGRADCEEARSPDPAAVPRPPLRVEQ